MSKIKYIVAFLILGILTGAQSQNQARDIVILTQKNSVGNDLVSQVQTELTNLLQHEYSLRFHMKEVGWNAKNIQSTIMELEEDSSSDIIISLSPGISQALLFKDSIVKPTIASMILDPEFQAPVQMSKIIQKDNFSLVPLNHSIREDLSTLKDLFKCDTIDIITSDSLLLSSTGSEKYLFDQAQRNNLKINLISLSYQSNNIETLGSRPLYIMPLFGLADHRQKSTSIINQYLTKKQPVFGMLYNHLAQGALATNAPELGARTIARKIAINTANLINHRNTSSYEAPLELTRKIILNMKAIRQTNFYPDWEWINQSEIVNVDYEVDENHVDLFSVIAEALENNLDIKTGVAELEYTRKEIDKASSELLPKIEGNTQARWIDQDRADASFGVQPSLALTTGARMSQIIYSESAYSSIAIQKIRMMQQEANQDQIVQDIIHKTALTYLKTLQAKSILNVRNDNLQVTQKHLTIAKNKAYVGIEGPSDVHRWETQLAFNRTEVNEALANLQKAKFQLNQLLNRPINSSIHTPDSISAHQADQIIDPKIIQILKNESDFQQLCSFLEHESIQKVPEIKQLKAAILAQERVTKSLKRSFYTPTISIGFQADHFIARSDQGAQNIPVEFEQLIPTRPNNLNLSAGLNVSLPLFNGGGRKISIQQQKIKDDQLQIEKMNLQNNLVLRTRSSLEDTKASFMNLQMASDAKTAASSNLTIAQNAYAEGAISIAQLVDAQNAALKSNEYLSNARYTFFAQVFTSNRAIGTFHFLLSEDEKTNFFQRWIQFNQK